MYYKVLKGTSLFDSLIALRTEMQRCGDEAFALVESLGYKEFREYGGPTIAGGISSIIVETGKPENWKNAYQTHLPNEYLPAKKVCNKELLAKIEALPVVTYQDLNGLVGLHSRWSHPGFTIKEDFAVLNFSEKRMKDLTPNADMIEITRSEYITLESKEEPEKI